MPKEKPHQGGEPVRGGDVSTVSQNNFNGNIPLFVIEKLEREIQGVNFGGVSLIVAIRDGRLSFRIEKTVSIITTGD